MKHKSLLKYLIFFIFLQGCCCKKECLGIQFFPVKFQNFNKGEIDSLRLVTYETNLDFHKAVDSLIIQIKSSSDTFYINSDATKNFELVVVKTNTRYKFNDFRFKKESCNSCILGNDLYDLLTTYKINDKEISIKDIAVLKK